MPSRSWGILTKESSPNASVDAADLGDCVRPYGSGCTQNACIRCNFLTVHPDAKARLTGIEGDIGQRITQTWEQHLIADIEQLKITLHRLRGKQAQLSAHHQQRCRPSACVPTRRRY